MTKLLSTAFGRVFLVLATSAAIILALKPELVFFQAIIALIIYLVLPNRSGLDDAASNNGKAGETFAGEIVDLGSAPYEHKEDGTASFFITLRHGDKNHTLWGIDLARVAREKRLQRGDRAELFCRGRQPVKVKNRQGKIIHTHRNTWDATVHSRCYSGVAEPAA